MKNFHVLLLYAFVIMVVIVEVSAKKKTKTKNIPEQDLAEWKNFKIKFVKQYKTKQEALKRRKIFLDNLKLIRKHNARYENGTETFRVGINNFADLTTNEFVTSRNRYKRSTSIKGLTFNITSSGVITSSVDWRTKGAVTDVKDEGVCGASWAFSATGSLEGQTFQKTGKLISLSEQNLIDCSGPYGNEGCSGGNTDYAFEYVLGNGGVDTENAYPYRDRQASCKYKKSSKGTVCTGYVDIPYGSESKLQVAVNHVGPISAAIDASSPFFQFYESGVYSPSDCSTMDLNRGVLVVGYGSSSGCAYWLVKNSWGTDWGLSGYFMLAKDKNNMCGIASEASYPIV